MRAVLVVVAVISIVAAAAVSAAPAVAEPAAPDTIGLVDTATGEWHLRGDDGWTTSFYFGNPGDTPMVGDWDCDGIDTPGLYRRSDGFVYLRNSNSQGIADIRFFFGNPDDVPLAGDFDGDGCDTVSVYRPAEGRVFIIDELGADEGGLGAAEIDYYFGNPGDQPFTGDFDGDGVDTIGLHRSSTGYAYFRNSHSSGVADGQMYFGDPGDRFVAGDWTGDGVDSPAVFRPSDATIYLRHTLSEGVADAFVVFGSSQWIPVAGSFGLGSLPIDERSWSVEVVDSVGDVGRFNDIAIGEDGLPLISYGSALGLSVHELRVARCHDGECRNATTESVHGAMFESTAIAVQPDGTPVVAFHDPWARGLGIASCADAACSSAVVDIVYPPPGGAVQGGELNEIVITDEGRPLVVTTNYNHFTVLVAGGAEWSSATVAGRDEFSRPSITVGRDGLPRIALPLEPEGSVLDEDGLPTVLTYPLALASCGDAGCSFGLITRRTIHTEVVTGADVTAGGASARSSAHTGVVVDHELRPWVAVSWVHGPGLELVRCEGPACLAPTTIPITGAGGGRFVDLALTADGVPIMAYTDGSGAVRVTMCEDAACATPRTATLAEPGPGTEVSLAVDRLGMPVVAWYDAAVGDLVVARLR